MSFQISGLDPTPFRHLYGLSDEALAAHGAKRYVANKKPGFPDRVEVRDAEPGETLVLLNYEHQPADTPYRASHAIFVREGAEQAYRGVDVIPEALKVRPISLRAFNNAGEMVDADLVDGKNLVPLIDRFFANLEVTYLHAHYAKRGCYAARIDRASTIACSPSSFSRSCS
jgi:hypothetical protein